MTKKMTKLLSKYESNLNCIVSLYRKGIYDFDKSIDSIIETQEDFSNMIHAAWRYGLISEKEFDHCWDEETRIYNIAVGKVEDY